MDVSLKDVSGWIFLYVVVRWGNWKCVILFIEVGVDFGEYV